MKTTVGKLKKAVREASRPRLSPPVAADRAELKRMEKELHNAATLMNRFHSKYMYAMMDVETNRVGEPKGQMFQDWTELMAAWEKVQYP